MDQHNQTRPRKVLMTALCAKLGLLRVALSHAIGTQTQTPLAFVVIGAWFRQRC